MFWEHVVNLSMQVCLLITNFKIILKKVIPVKYYHGIMFNWIWYIYTVKLYYFCFTMRGVLKRVVIIWDTSVRRRRGECQWTLSAGGERGKPAVHRAAGEEEISCGRAQGVLRWCWGLGTWPEEDVAILPGRLPVFQDQSLMLLADGKPKNWCGLKDAFSLYIAVMVIIVTESSIAKCACLCLLNTLRTRI